MPSSMTRTGRLGPWAACLPLHSSFQQLLDSLLAVAGRGNRIAFTLQRFLNVCSQAGFVFHDKDVDSGFIHAATEPVV
jgi:hypothetical protein